MLFPLRLCIAALICATSAHGADWYVDAGAAPGGDGSHARPFRNIALAISTAGNGDAIRIAPGVYRERLIVDKDLRIFGARGAHRTRIDAALGGRVIDVPNPCTLELFDLELERGAAQRGAGIRAIGAVLRLSRVRIADCLFGDPTFGGSGGGILQQGGSLRLDACEIVENSGVGSGLEVGGGIDASFARVEISSSLVAANRAGFAGGISVWGDLFVRGSTIANNSAGGVVQTSGRLTVESSILWANGGASIQLQQGASGSVMWSTVQGSFAGPGNLAADPRFLDESNGDYRLRAESPCIDFGDPAAALRGVDMAYAPRFLDGDLDGDMRQDQGAYERAHVELLSFGAVAPGGTFGIGLNGESGWLGVIYLAEASREIWIPPHGALLFDPAATFFSITAGALPFGIAIPVPLEIPRWFEAHFQGVGLWPAPLALECSNALVLHAY